METNEYDGILLSETETHKIIDFGLKEPVKVPKRRIKGETPSSRYDQNKLIAYELSVSFAIDAGLE